MLAGILVGAPVFLGTGGVVGYQFTRGKGSQRQQSELVKVAELIKHHEDAIGALADSTVQANRRMEELAIRQTKEHELFMRLAEATGSREEAIDEAVAGVRELKVQQGQRDALFMQISGQIQQLDAFAAGVTQQLGELRQRQAPPAAGLGSMADLLNAQAAAQQEFARRQRAAAEANFQQPAGGQ